MYLSLKHGVPPPFVLCGMAHPVIHGEKATFAWTQKRNAYNQTKYNPFLQFFCGVG